MTAPAHSSVLLDGLTRLEKADRVSQLHKAGFTMGGIADMLGISRSYASSLFHDPDGTADRERKLRYGGVCVDCGGPTNNNGGHPVPTRCQKCSTKHLRETLTFWTEERIIASIQEWNELYGSPPAATDWLKKVDGSPGQYTPGPRSGWVGQRRWPTVHSCQDRFGSWANALRAAGFEPRKPFMLTEEWQQHHWRNGRPVVWTEEMIIAALQVDAKRRGRSPTSRDWETMDDGRPCVTTVMRRFGTWNNAVRAAGLTPRRKTPR